MFAILDAIAGTIVKGFLWFGDHIDLIMVGLGLLLLALAVLSTIAAKVHERRVFKKNWPAEMHVPHLRDSILDMYADKFRLDPLHFGAMADAYCGVGCMCLIPGLILWYLRQPFGSLG